MELSFDNLEEIHEMLLKAKSGADVVMRILDSNENEKIKPTPENRVLLNTLIDKVSGHLLEVSHVDSFFQSCDSRQIESLNAEKQNTLIKCQILCQSLRGSSKKTLEWIFNTKKEFNDLSCPVSSYTSNTTEEKSKNESDIQADKSEYQHTIKKHISPEMIEEYHNARDTLKELHKDILFYDPENMTNTDGRRLKVMDGKSLFLETEHEMNVFVDFGLFQYYKNGKNIAQRFFDAHASLYSGQNLKILTSFKNTRFSLLEIVSPVDDYGLIVKDHLTGEDLLMIDKGLCETAKREKKYVILTHYLCLSEFVMTTGASTPILINSDIEKDMQAIFSNLVQHHQKQKILDEKTYKQCITDLYKIAIHGDAMKIVHARELPMNYHKANKEELFVH